ncbi:hypothetical protein CORC01_02917 [Colletotrichum orchidophilum]|uniref:Uncharacterized protein n=1 Tax=Colletotrichum orchidophilum TaxID=1209926 RepID=A0A1G4BK88_9PEZI|nr:uncharacterized protein CORC01_02917 [Colletotrichum orchidophilum]OHF01726.1 hypothetical protein CORC01_02917 [Colletotrichum orchidophilum]
MKGFGPWEDAIDYTKVAVQRAIDRRTDTMSRITLSTVKAVKESHRGVGHTGDRTEKNDSDYVAERERIKVCRPRGGGQEDWIRFVPADAAPLEISSTRIRKFLEEDSSIKTLDELRETVLHPELLEKMMLEYSR